jgi:hypothetical protein
MSELELYNDSDNQTYSKPILCVYNKNEYGLIETCLFIGWDYNNGDYFIRGRKNDQDSTTEYVPYAFHCERTDDVYDFIYFVMGTMENVSVSLYNYNNMDGMSDDQQTYEFFEYNLDDNYEIMRCNNVSVKYLTRLLRMLKNLYNWDSNVENNSENNSEDNYDNSEN